MNLISYPAHTLLWVKSLEICECETKDGIFLREYLRKNNHRPVVVRRAWKENYIPVGIRGESRSDRMAAWVKPNDILYSLTPEELVRQTLWNEQYKYHPLKQFLVLNDINKVFLKYNMPWGVGGSVGFELATSIVSANENSDLDLIIYLPQEVDNNILVDLWNELHSLFFNIDVQIETPNGAFALKEWLCSDFEKVMIKTIHSPILIANPWQIL